VSNEGPLAFLDANVLARPVTRTLLLIGAVGSGARYRAVWSAYAEAEGQRHLRAGTVGLADLRNRHRIDLSASGVHPERFTATDPKDRQVLADAEHCGALFLVTANVRDFGVADLDAVGVSAVHPDLFASYRISPERYLEALTVLARGEHPLADMHSALARAHPLLFEARRDSFPGIEPQPTHDHPPAEAFRGSTCVRCGRLLTDPANTVLGVGPDCASTHE
jgi:hypothetical protein